ncbi:hypothetical protein BLD44_005375 [Mastigocladus laminosus UU774]|nr:hypothetical protein BLD44_005375 [Mastigocladus laminosus UU774]
MIKLSTDELLYLLYAYSYSLKQETVTKYTLKKDLSKQKLKEDTDCIYNALLKYDLIESPTKGRLFVTNKGINILVDNLVSTDYRFSTLIPKARLLNTLIKCIKMSSSVNQVFNTTENVDFDTFVEKFKEVYFTEKKRQEINGIVAIHKQDIYNFFMKNKSIPISQTQLEEYFDRLKLVGKIFTSAGEEDELVHWAE